MSETRNSYTWRSLPNPFLSFTDTTEVITSHVSGRSKDITEIITGGQSAVILAGAPRIGKSALIRYLQRSPDAEWSWRNELSYLRDLLNPDDIHFVQIDLTPLEGIENVKELLAPFITQCMVALRSIWHGKQPTSGGLKGLRELLQSMSHETPNARYFIVLDSIERLARPDMQFKLESGAQTAQERGIALLNHCEAFRTLVDLMDEFTNFGVLLSIESLARPNISDQFTHVSADLARFSTIILQTFMRDDTIQFLAQEPESFGTKWARIFKALSGATIFSEAEQTWLYEQAGTHPYLLQQFCFHTFNLKREYANRQQTWMDLQESDKDQLIERINERLSTFFASTWKRLQEAVDKSSPETKKKYYEFVKVLKQKRADEEIDHAVWNQLGSELRYILYGEGIVRYDPLQPIFYPGSLLSLYLTQKAKEQSVQSSFLPLPTSGRELIISMPGKQPDHLSLSDLEFRLLRTLLKHPDRCNEAELMKAAWGKMIDRPVFTQRIHHLRKKLRDHTEGLEIIENHYGGYYSLNHFEWLQLE